MSYYTSTTTSNHTRMKNNKQIAYNRSNNFYRWILTQRKANGDRYSISSANQYRSQLRNFEHKLAPRALEGTQIPSDLFEIDAALDFEAAINIIETLPGYGDFIAENHGNFEAAVDLYGRFLLATARR